MNNQRKCQLGDYGEETMIHQTTFILNYKLTVYYPVDFRATWPIKK